VQVRLLPLQLKIFFDLKFTSYIYLYKKLFKQKQTNMKKVIAIFAIATTLVSCGGNASTEVKTTDSTTVSTDSTTVSTDTTAVKTDSTVNVK
jgi:hypothetical protein